MHEDHACVFCRHPWQFSLTDSMSKHVSAYMSGDVETTFVYAAVMMQFFIHASFPTRLRQKRAHPLLYGYSPEAF